MDLRKENYSLKGFLLSLCLLAYHFSIGQSACKIWVASEPSKTSVTRIAAKVEQTTFDPYASWSDLSQALTNDNKNATISFPKQGLSNTLKFSDFGLNIPDGATIHGIKIKLHARSEGQGFIKDYKVKLSSGEDKAGHGYNIKNVWAKSSVNKSFYYGFEDDTWSASWSAQQLNAAQFSVEIQLLNSVSKAITASLDYLEVEVFYTPLATFCLTDCFPVYVDPIPGATSFLWHFPNGFEMISRSEQHYIIDFKVMNAAPGLHNVCVDALDAQGNVIDQCCRTLRLRNCTPATLGDMVWNDINHNGVQDTGEPGISNVKVDLYAENNALIQTKTTDALGKYLFNNITEGNYYVSVNLPNNFLVSKVELATEDKDNDFLSTTTNRSASLFIPYGSNATNLDFGLVKKLMIGDFVWEDLNYNGQQDAGEKGITNVPVVLRSESGQALDTVLTNNVGQYLFQDLPADKYVVNFQAAQEYLPTKKNQATLDKDSNINPDGATDVNNFQNVETNKTIDAGFFRYASIGDFVWEDVNKNGLQDQDEAGTPAITLYLFDNNNTLVDSTLTDSNGGYTFDSIVPGSYYIKLDLPKDAFPTSVVSGDLGSDLLDINGDYRTNPITLFSNDQLKNIDLGYQVGKSLLSGLVWNDDNFDGRYDVGETLLPGQWVYLLDGNDTLLDSVLTDGNGQYQFDNLSSGDYSIAYALSDEFQFTDANVGNDDADSDIEDRTGFGKTQIFSFVTSDTVNFVFIGIVNRSVIGDFIWIDVNYNGGQDAGEIGIAGVGIALLDENGNVVSTTVSQNNGSYLFEKVVTGNYRIEVDVPSLYLVTKNTFADVLSNSDVDSDGKSTLFAVELGVDRRDIDAGFVKKLTIGDFVWEDKNGNGVQDLDENGIEGLDINLLDESGAMLLTTTTSTIGQYTFDNVPATQYNFQIATPGDFKATLYKIGNVNTDNDLQQDYTTGLVDFSDQSFNNTIDFGLYKTACIGDLAWIDVNEDGSYDANDEVLEDVLINLYDEAGQLIKISITDSLGRYEMCGLAPGNYYLEVVPNSAYIPTTKGTGSVLIEGEILPFYSDVFTLGSGDQNVDLDLGFLYRPKSKICGFVWFDENANGSYDEVETKKPDYRVTLWNEQQQLIAETTTDADGAYCFTDLGPASYYIKFYIGDTLQFTEYNVGTDDLDSDVHALVDSAFTDVIVIMGSSDEMSVSAGYTQRSSIGDFTWFDTNKDGLQGDTEPGLPGVSVQLLDENGTIIKTTTTGSGNQSGKYLFDKVVRGNYRLKFSSLPNLDFTLRDIDNVIGSDVFSDGFTALFAATPNTNNLDLDAGFALKGAGVGGMVWQDVNKDTIRNAGDTAVAGITVVLFDENHNLISTTTSDDQGNYVFFPLPAGNYYIRFDTLEFWSYQKADDLFIYSDVDHSNGRGTTYDFTLTDGFVIGGVDCALVDARATIEGYAWSDKNGNGIFQGDEISLADVWVHLWKEGVSIDSVLTDENGYYLFEELLPGQYVLSFDSLGDNFMFGIKQAGLDSLVDSDVNLDGLTDTISVGFCQRIMGINAAYRGFGKVIGQVFNDEDENGLRDDAVPGLNNVHVCILDANNNVIQIDTTETIDNVPGRYHFDRVPAGQYKIKIQRPLFYMFTIKDANGNLNDDIDSDVAGIGNFDAFSDLFTLETNAGLNVDAGLIFRVPMDSKISGQVWRESSYNGLREGGETLVSGTELILYNELNVEIKRTTSNANGYYEFKDLSEGFYYIKATLDDTLTTALYGQGNDKTIDNDFYNADILDATPPFYLGISQDTQHVDLGIAEEISIGDFVWSDDNDNGIQDAGEPGISALGINLRLPGNQIYRSTTSDLNGQYDFVNLPRGSYLLEFKIPPGYSSARKNTGAAAVNSDINTNGYTDLLNLIQPDNNDIDAGLVKNGSIGNRIWVDLNSNGIQDNGEPGLNGATLKLYDENDVFIAQTSSSATQGGIEGIYSFFDVRPGNYYLEIDGPQGYTITRFNIGAALVNSDLKTDGLTDVFTVLPNEMKEDIDAGFYLPACIGDRVWIDLNQNGIQDSGESGLAGVEVILFRSNGQPIDTLVTDAEGKYLFTGLTQGLYSLKFKINPPYSPTLQDEGEDNTDSDIGSDGATPLISLAHGVKFLDLDAGLVQGNNIQAIVANQEEVIEKTQTNVLVWPNPALNDIEVNHLMEDGEIFIFDANGRIKMKMKNAGNSIRLKLHELPAGLYVLVSVGKGGVKQTTFTKYD